MSCNVAIVKGTRGRELSGGETGEEMKGHNWKDLANWTKHLGLYLETVQSQGRLLKQRFRKVILRAQESQIGGK